MSPVTFPENSSMQLGTASAPEASSAGGAEMGKERSSSETITSSADNPLTQSTVLNDLEPRRDTTISPAVVTNAGTLSTHTPLPPHVVSEAPNISSTIKPRSRPASRDTSPYPRSRPSTPNRPSTPSSSANSPIRTVPPRRSARTLAKGPERPRGPPELEAALTIAIRNLESDIYEWWCANQKPGSPIPTTAYLKARSPRIRRAAEAVDEADRLVNEAVYGKPRKRRSIGMKHKGLSASGEGDIPDTAFGQLELNSQPERSSPLRPAQIASKSGDGDGQPRRSTRNKESPGD